VYIRPDILLEYCDETKPGMHSTTTRLHNSVRHEFKSGMTGVHINIISNCFPGRTTGGATCFLEWCIT